MKRAGPPALVVALIAGLIGCVIGCTQDERVRDAQVGAQETTTANDGGQSNSSPANQGYSEDLSLCIQAWKETESGNHKRALELFRECIETGTLSDASLAQTYRNMGIASHRDGQFQEAIEFFDKSLSLKPSNPWMDYVNRGNAWSELQAYDKALKEYDIALKVKPHFSEAYFNRGVVFDKQNKKLEAIEEYKKAYQFGLRSQRLYERMVIHGLITKEPDQKAEIDPNDADTNFDLGREFLEAGQFGTAIEYLTQVVQKQPTNAEAYASRGLAWLELGSYDKAIGDFTDVIRIHPDSAIAYGNRGNARLEMRQNDKAIEDFTEMLRIDPDNADAYGNRGLAWVDKGEYERGIGDLNESIRIDPNRPGPYGNRGIAFFRIRKFDKAIEDFTRVIELDANNVAAYGFRGACWEAKGDVGKAESDRLIAKKIQLNQ